jgi:hypothetical protein
MLIHRLARSLECPRKRAQVIWDSEADMHGPVNTKFVPGAATVASTPAYSLATPHSSVFTSGGQAPPGPHYQPSINASSPWFIYGHVYTSAFPYPPYSSTARSPGLITPSSSLPPNPPLPSAGSSSTSNQASPGTRMAAVTPATNELVGGEGNVRSV